MNRFASLLLPVSVMLLVSGVSDVSGGSIVCWGYNAYGQCDVPDPNQDFVALSAGNTHSLGLKEDSSIVAWGNNSWGQCAVPTPNEDFIAIAAGFCYSLGLKADGSIVCWGYNGHGQCDVPAPNEGFVAITAGKGAWISGTGNPTYVHSLGLKQDGTIVAWGGNNCGQCNVPNPNQDFVALSAGGMHSLGLKEDGSIVAWGSNNCGQCNVPNPNQDFVALSAGGMHNLSLKEDGTIVGWGSNSFGCCDVPPPNTDFIAITANCYTFMAALEPPLFSLGLKSDSSIVAWGCNYSGQCNVPSPNQNFVAIAGGISHSLGLKSINTGIELQPNPEILQINAINPNPATSTVSVHYSSPGLLHVSLEVYDMSGHLVSTSEMGAVLAGQHTVTWDGRSDMGEMLSSGIYLIRLVGEGISSDASKVILIR